MKRLRCLTVIVVLSMALSSQASALDDMSNVSNTRKPAPGAAMAAAALNILFMPMRLAVTVLFAELGGITGLMTGGDEQAANDVWNVVGGTNFLTPKFIEGKEPMDLDSYHQDDDTSSPDVVESFGYGFPFQPAVPGGRDGY